MKKGTTPRHKFTIPIPVSEIVDAEITYCQNRKEILKKHLNECQTGDDFIQFKLTQEETFLFDESANVEIQLRVLTNGSDCYASDIFSIPCKRCLSKDVLT